MGTCRTRGRSPRIRRIVLGIWLVALTFGGTASGQTDAAVTPPGSDHPAVPAFSTAPGDTFAHARHQSVPCLGCHLAQTGARLTFVPPLGCRNCHHGERQRHACVECHEPARLPDTLQVRFAVAAAGKAAHERVVAFPHGRHATLRCTSCHGGTVSRAPVDSAGSCAGCHDKHGDAGRACAVCHRTPETMGYHAAPARPHVACDECHATAVIARLTPTRSLCLACHDSTVDHNPGRECTGCHMQATPEAYRGRLLHGSRP